MWSGHVLSNEFANATVKAWNIPVDGKNTREAKYQKHWCRGRNQRE